jgi:hypothetical protein
VGYPKLESQLCKALKHSIEIAEIVPARNPAGIAISVVAASEVGGDHVSHLALRRFEGSDPSCKICTVVLSLQKHQDHAYTHAVLDNISKTDTLCANHALDITQRLLFLSSHSYNILFVTLERAETNVILA